MVETEMALIACAAIGVVGFFIGVLIEYHRGENASTVKAQRLELDILRREKINLERELGHHVPPKGDRNGR